MTVSPPSNPRMEELEEPSDSAVIAQSCHDPERFSVIFDRYFGEIHRYVASRLGHSPADDVAAETFLAAFAQRDRYDAERQYARAWLYGIATNLVRRHRRTEERAYRAIERAPVDGDIGGHADRIAEQVSAQRMQPRLAAALAELSARDRDVLLLVAYAELSYDEVALALDIRPGTVGSRLNRARRHLRRSIGDNPLT